jgi:hypothetical protein
MRNVVGIRSAPGTNLVIAIDLSVEPVDLCNLQDTSKLHKNIDNTISKHVDWTMFVYVANANLRLKKGDSYVSIATLV